MRRRVPLQKLRGSDPTLLEVQIQDLLGRPSGQLEPANLCDLFALAELEEPPRSIRSELEQFVKRCRQEIAEIPDGLLPEFCDDYAAVEPARVPATLRALVLELSGRESRDGAGLSKLAEGWSAEEPQAFELGAGTVRVQRATAKPPAPARRAGIGKAEAKPARSSSKAPRRAAAKTVVDVDRRNWMVETVLERLATSQESGLGQAVLIAGIRHRAREQYPKLAPHEITAVLNELLKLGRVRKSAGRWFRTR